MDKIGCEKMTHKHNWQLAKYERSLWSQGMTLMVTGNFATFVCEWGKEKFIRVKK